MNDPVRIRSRALGLALLVLAGGGGLATAQDVPDPLQELRAEADRTLKLRKSDARHRLGIVLAFAERLRQNGDRKAARQYVDKVLKLDPWAMEAHLMLAEMTREDGDAAATEKKANWLLEHAETDRIRTGVLNLLERSANTSIPDIERVPGTAVKIVLVPIGTVDILLLKAAADRVMRSLNYEVLIQRAGLELPPDAETPLRPLIDELRKRFVPLLDTPEGEAALQAAGRSRSQLDAEETFLVVYRTWLERQGKWRELADLEAKLRTEYHPRWNANVMLRHFASVLGPYGRPNVMYIGVSRSTMWSRVFRSDRDVFGWGGKEVAVMTYGPFLSSRSGESPDWERLVARTTKQIICTVGSAFEVGRCRNPKCPMRVVYDLRSVDAKGYEPCKDCAARLRKRY